MSDVLNGAKWRVDEGDCLAWLRGLPDGFAQCCVTSPPYWGLRDYGEPGQLGLEATPEEFVANMVAVFGEVRRVLREDGVLWLNIGDSYAGSWGNYHPNSPPGKHGQRVKETARWNREAYEDQTFLPPTANCPGLKPKDLCMIPARLALALQADGWYLRSDVIWYKPNPMPESVTDRPTSAHEHVFLLAKSERYFYDGFAVRETGAGRTDLGQMTSPARLNQGGPWANTEKPDNGRNLRNVWEIPTQGTPEAHFATYPEALVEPCIKAGSSDRACSECGAAWQRVVTKSIMPHPNRYSKQPDAKQFTVAAGDYGEAGSLGMAHLVQTVDFTATCNCAADVTGSIVIDPFTGSGTTGRVALRLGRRFLGCELNPEYAAMSRRRIASYHVKPVRPRQADDDRQITMFTDTEETA